MAYFKHCAEENVVHTEIMFDPQTHTKRGISFGTVINGIQKARRCSRKIWNFFAFNYELSSSFIRGRCF
jgi:adenosine deaminase